VRGRTILFSLLLALATALPAVARGYSGRPDRYPSVDDALWDHRMRGSPWWQATLVATWLGLDDKDFWILYDVLTHPKGLVSVFETE